ncbi:MAG TPA: respiratory nitrate reductase subunit gamma [Methanosarcina vacuolata]|jgi:heterodisulfide reductase subunit E|nr:MULTISPECIES: dihydromethanophenazine:CoB--CoM heterodisulfide reductase subunit HdrE [Methanosarcina]AKB48540.1 CoB--CoM heterodisulfide reductase 2 subunit E [Methanosarcina sp. Kolksee]HPS89315.1 respiratory nitrate reductase subunit gamma [Methanosarcina vacuolata]
MLYFSGLSDALRLTFVQVMIMATLAFVIFIYGLIVAFQKWGTGVTGYALEPQEGKKGSAITFLKTWWKQVTEESHHHGTPILEILILDIVFQRRILKRSPFRWIMHLCIFGGWMTLFALSGLMFTVEITEKIGIELPFTPDVFREWLSIPNYVFGYILLIGVLIAIVRRLFVSEVREASIMYDWVLIGVIFIVTISGFLADGIRTGLIWSFGLDPAAAPPAALFHSIFSLLFCIAFIPYSKYIHVIAIPLALLANKGGE